MSAQASLGSVAELIRGVTFTASDAHSAPVHGSLPILRAGNIQDALDIASDLVWVDSALVSPSQRFRLGDIAVCMSSGSARLVGKSAVLTEPFDGSVGAFCAIVRPRHELDPDYLGHFLRSPEYWSWRDRSARGVGIQNLKVADLHDLPIPLPPLDEQRRIAARLAYAILEARAALDAVEARSGELGGLRQSAIAAAFHTTLNAARPALGSIGRLVDGDWILNADYAPSGVRLLQVGDVGRGQLTIKSDRHVTEQRAAELKCTLLAPGDILISRMPQPLGRACLLPDLGYPCITAVDVTIMRADPAKVTTGYLVEYLNSDEWYEAADAKSSGATRARISRKNLELLRVPLPPVDEQRRIAARLREQLAEIDRAKTALDAQRKAIDALPAALLREVFGASPVGG